MDNITFVGLDMHKATVCMSVAESGRDGEVRQIGVCESRPEVLSRMVTRLGKNGRRFRFCCEAGPCGYGLQRLLTDAGHECVVVAPSLIPIKAGERGPFGSLHNRRIVVGQPSLDRGLIAFGRSPDGFLRREAGLEQANRMAAQIETGGVFINGDVASDPRITVGGVKKSGFGRELSSFGLHEVCNIQTVWIDRRRSRAKAWNCPGFS